MSKPTLGNPQNTIEILQKYHFNFQKKFGQNFLIDTHVLEKIISAAGITKDDMVLEIGPGIGTMTQYLAEAAGKVAAVDPWSCGEGERRTSGEGGCESSILHYDSDHYGAVRRKCSG